MDDLVVHCQLTAAIVDDKNTDRAASISERVVDTLIQLVLVNDGQTLLNITSLGHGDDTAVSADVEHAVLLENGTKHGLDDNAGLGVGDERALLVQLLGEEVDAQVAVLASLG